MFGSVLACAKSANVFQKLKPQYGVLKSLDYTLLLRVCYGELHVYGNIACEKMADLVAVT